MGIKIYTVGVGSEGVARIMAPDQYGRMIPQLLPVQVDEPALKQIAQIGEGQYFRATDAKSLEGIFKQIDQLEKSKIETSTSTSFRELFPEVIIAGLLLLLIWVMGRQMLGRGLP
jgi:Ca-activated chloride channel family protein